jgi:DNA-binding GntR family transcriptional regulator
VTVLKEIVRKTQPDAQRREESRGSKADQIYEALKLAIISGEIAPASVIDKNEIAARFRVSRFPVTTAINRLAYERLVVIEPQRGSFVSLLRLGDIREWMIARRALETEVAILCARDLDTRAIENLERNLRYQETGVRSGDLTGFHDLDMAFHRQMVHGLRLYRVDETLESIRSHVDRVRRLLLPAPGRMASTYDEHLAIFRAIQARDAEAAAKAMRTHIDGVLDMLSSFEHEHPQFFTN